MARHGESEYNVQGRLNGDPSVDVPLSPRGREEAHELGIYLAQAPFEVCLHTRFPRTLQTASIALSVSGADVPLVCEARLDDIHVGDLEGLPAEEYHRWKADHSRDDAIPGGESVRAAAERYATALRSLAERPEALALVICHELPLRFTVNAALSSEDLAGPQRSIANAAPYLFDRRSLLRASEQIAIQAQGAWGRARSAPVNA